MEKVLGWLVEYLTFFFFCLGQVLVAVCGIYFPNQGLNLGSLHWERGVLATGPQGKSQKFILKCTVDSKTSLHSSYRWQQML